MGEYLGHSPQLTPSAILFAKAMLEVLGECDLPLWSLPQWGVGNFPSNFVEGGQKTVTGWIGRSFIGISKTNYGVDFPLLWELLQFDHEIGYAA